MSTQDEDELRKGIVAVLKRYRGITGRMDLSINSPLVIDLANMSRDRSQVRQEQIEKEGRLSGARAFKDTLQSEMVANYENSVTIREMDSWYETWRERQLHSTNNSLEEK